MNPVKHLPSELKRGIARAWESLSDGWRELLSRNSGALTHFRKASKQGAAQPTGQDFPSWGLLAGETWETALSVIVHVELPGMNGNDLDISVHGSTLQIRGEKRSEGEHRERTYHLMERAYGRFHRTISLPHEVDGTGAEVTYRDGILTVILNKTEAIPPTRLTIR